MINKIIELAKNYTNPIIVCCKENMNLYSFPHVIPVASKYCLEDYSRNLFSCLRKASSFSPDIILVEGVKKEGIGIAIMNRLENICDIYNI